MLDQHTSSRAPSPAVSSMVVPDRVWYAKQRPFPSAPDLRLGPTPAQYLGLTEAAKTSFVPSRHRSLSSTALTASTGLQPTGRALPPLIARNLPPDLHWQQACFGVAHPLAQLPPLPPKLVLAAQGLRRLGGDVVAWREQQLNRVRCLAERLRETQQRWREGLRPQVRKVIGGWHMPLLHVLAREAGSEDIFFALDFSSGARCVGRAAHSFAMPLKLTKPRMTVGDLLASAPGRNQRILASIRTSGDPALDKESLEKTQQELQSGLMLGPWQASELPSSIAVVSRRFPIWEQHGSATQRKCRNIDELSESCVNSTVEDYETYVPHGIEHILGLVRLLRELFGSDVNLAGYTADFKAAYRQVALSPLQRSRPSTRWGSGGSSMTQQALWKSCRLAPPACKRPSSRFCSLMCFTQVMLPDFAASSALRWWLPLAGLGAPSCPP